MLKLMPRIMLSSFVFMFNFVTYWIFILLSLQAKDNSMMEVD